MQSTESLRFSLALLLAVVVVVLAAPPQNQKEEFNFNEYLYGVDSDLQARVRAAIELERSAIREKANKKSGAKPCRVMPEPSCPPSKYRTPTGVCNNIRHPSWGARGSPYIRLLPPVYTDGIRNPKALPSASNVTSQIRERLSISEWPHKALSSLVGVWSELVLRDISLPIRPKFDQNCCQSNSSHPECFTSVDESKNCLNYWRNQPTLSTHMCNFKAREPMNGASGYLDGSDMYGNTDDKYHKIRSYDQGHVYTSLCELCNGDESSVSLLYQAILAEHNRIADQLAEINSEWDDDKLYHEARRAVVAQIQHITLNEFAPSVLGETALNNKELVPFNFGSYKGYSSNKYGGAFDAVALAALQALTSLQNNKSSDLKKQTILAARSVDLNLAQVETAEGWNSTALLIHMARDYGLPGYVEYKKFCTGGKVQVEDFASFKDYMDEKDFQLLEKIYSRVEDVDLLIGGILEKTDKGAAMGPTFTCLLREQFIRLRNSDRFWYENDIPPSSLKPEQIAEIRKVSLAGLLCANTEITQIQPKPFIQQDKYINSKIDCDQYSPLGLAAWSEKSVSTEVKLNEVTYTPATETSLSTLSKIDEKMISRAFEKAEQDLIARIQIQYNAWINQNVTDPKSSAGTAASFSKANKDALRMANTSILFELTTTHLIKGIDDLQKLTLYSIKNQINELLRKVNMTKVVPIKNPTNHEEVNCPVDHAPCDPNTPYRTFTGRCNNLKNPSFGQSLTTYVRLSKPAYEDGISKPKLTGVTGSPLPNPRSVSTLIHPDVSHLHNRYTLMVMQFAQFLDHDLTMTPIHKGFAESIPSCRACDSAISVHPECNPFPIPENDHFYPTTNKTDGKQLCIPSMRSLPGQQNLGSREQVNQNTAFLDASVIYGENACINKVIRSPINGRMHVTKHKKQGKDLLPQSATHPECKAPSGYCFIGGDNRASEQPGLTVIHTIWVREHNRIVERLKSINPHWVGEKLFQETRRIISAMLQHITYNELLPRIVGQSTVNKYNLNLLSQGYYKGYSPECNGGILNEFVTAAYRIGHSLLRPNLTRMNKNYEELEPIRLRDGFYNPHSFYERDTIDELIRGLVGTPMESLDQFTTEEVTNHLFEQKNIPFSGFDLIALNIQRSRDHGLPGYNSYRELCGLKKAKTFEDLSEEITSETIKNLKTLYVSVDDIDLFPGGMSERPLPGGSAGPTFACIIAKQFNQTRKCDRFWYETADPKIRFTEAQLGEIRKVSLAKVVCNNMNTEENIQQDVFDLPSFYYNPRVSCKSLPEMKFEAWRETNKSCAIGGKNIAVGKSSFPSACTKCVCTNTGSQCASYKVDDCSALLKQVKRDVLLKDEACIAQCGSKLDAPKISPIINGFKVPDISEFDV